MFRLPTAGPALLRQFVDHRVGGVGAMVAALEERGIRRGRVSRQRHCDGALKAKREFPFNLKVELHLKKKK